MSAHRCILPSFNNLLASLSDPAVLCTHPSELRLHRPSGTTPISVPDIKSEAEDPPALPLPTTCGDTNANPQDTPPPPPTLSVTSLVPAYPSAKTEPPPSPSVGRRIVDFNHPCVIVKNEATNETLTIVRPISVAPAIPPIASAQHVLAHVPAQTLSSLPMLTQFSDRACTAAISPSGHAYPAYAPAQVHPPPALPAHIPPPSASVVHPYFYARPLPSQWIAPQVTFGQPALPEQTIIPAMFATQGNNSYQNPAESSGMHTINPTLQPLVNYGTPVQAQFTPHFAPFPPHVPYTNHAQWSLAERSAFLEQSKALKLLVKAYCPIFVTCMYCEQHHIYMGAYDQLETRYDLNGLFTHLFAAHGINREHVEAVIRNKFVAVRP